jgi:hypothetical protein
MKGLPAKVFHGESTSMEKLKVNAILGCTILSAATLWQINVGINVAVERDWYHALRFYMVSADVSG